MTLSAVFGDTTVGQPRKSGEERSNSIRALIGWKSCPMRCSEKAHNKKALRRPVWRSRSPASWQRQGVPDRVHPPAANRGHPRALADVDAVHDVDARFVGGVTDRGVVLAQAKARPAAASARTNGAVLHNGSGHPSAHPRSRCATRRAQRVRDHGRQRTAPGHHQLDRRECPGRMSP
jgi:hypothetical protein